MSVTVIPSSSTDAPACRQKWRRVNRRRQSDPKVVNAAVPKHCVLSPGVAQARAVLRSIPEFSRMYRNRRETLAAILEALYEYQVGKTRTTHPGRAALARWAGVSEDTVKRCLRWLRRHGLLAIVALGRQAEFAAAGPDGQKINECSVYALLVPRQLPAPVDEFAPLPAVGGTHLEGENLTHARARENDMKDAAPQRLIDSPGATPPPRYRPELCWPGDRTTKTPLQRLAAASELRERDFLLRPMSSKDVRSVVKAHLVAGWTVSDLQDALAYRPDGQPWPHSGIPDTKDPRRLRGWLRYRLGAYVNAAGDVLPSRRQRQEAQRRRTTAERALQRRAALERDAERAARPHAGRSPAATAALAQMRALFRRGA